MDKKYYINNRKVAEVAAALTNYKCTTPASLTPMLGCYELYVRTSALADTEQNFRLFYRVARLMGWNVIRRRNEYFENGRKIH